MPTTQAVYYRDRDGREPVNDFIDSVQPVEAQVAIVNRIDLLNGLPMAAPPLAFPHSSQVSGELRELRCHYGSALYRVLYRRSRNLFVLLHALRKNTAAVPAGDIAIAETRWGDFKTRMDAPRRTPPRAAGRDAP